MNHFFKLLFLVFSQLLVVFHRTDMKTILCLRLGGFEWTSEDGHLGITNLLEGERGGERETERGEVGAGEGE